MKQDIILGGKEIADCNSSNFTWQVYYFNRILTKCITKLCFESFIFWNKRIICCSWFSYNNRLLMEMQGALSNSRLQFKYKISVWIIIFFVITWHLEIQLKIINFHFSSVKWWKLSKDNYTNLKNAHFANSLVTVSWVSYSTRQF